MEKKKLFYGTPLSRSLDDDQDKDGSISERSKRTNKYNKLQTVRDEQGRQRFHGAFTGGFSAGYFNTVDSVEGFQPKQFVSRKGASRVGHGFSHKPEDYMDEEDISEFGIAPKKIRINPKFVSDGEDHINRLIGNIVKPTKISIGEKILQHINSKFGNRKCTPIDNTRVAAYSFKNDYHGLGYKPLRKIDHSTMSKSLNNPLLATMSRGKRLKISGQAFGMGVLDEDDDFVFEHNAYGQDDISNYEFDDRKIKSIKMNMKPSDKKNPSDKYYLKGFIQCTDEESIRIFDDLLRSYPCPDIPENWKMPVRVRTMPQQDTTTQVDINLKFIPRPSTSSILDKKFTNATDLLTSHSIDTKAGLVHYSDLKAIRPAEKPDVVSDEMKQNDKPAIERRQLEWRPCSLLCKHFNVPNPYPDNLFCGVKNSQLVEENFDITLDQANLNESNNNLDQIFSLMELKRSIYNVAFLNNSQTIIEKSSDDSNVDDNYCDDYDEEKPQVVFLNETSNSDNEKSFNDVDEDNEIIVVPAVKPEPELIVLSSSSSSRSVSPVCSEPMKDKEVGSYTDEDDTYGPPLPPTLKTLIDCGQRKTNAKPKDSG